jgi:tRNA threonylcarbamoyladenosine dehydratase
MKRDALFQRTQLLMGGCCMEQARGKKVIIFGVGGVGSWCAESLARSGIGMITIVDSDRVCITNVNRQRQANVDTIGSVKVESLKNELTIVNPLAEINCIQKIYSEQTAESFNLGQYDYIVDAIDSLENKIHLLRYASLMPGQTVSSMGAALKMDPTAVEVSEFWKVKTCHLARRIRKLMRKGEHPAKKIACVYSQELLENKGNFSSCGSGSCLCPSPSASAPGDPALAAHEWCSSKAQINGSIAHMTAIFGFTIAGLIMKSIYTGRPIIE